MKFVWFPEYLILQKRLASLVSRSITCLVTDECLIECDHVIVKRGLTSEMFNQSSLRERFSWKVYFSYTDLRG